MISRQVYLSRFVTNPCLGSRLWNGRCELYSRPLAESPVPVLPPLSKPCENRKDRGATSSFTASEGTSYALTHALTHSYFTIPSSSYYSFFCRPSTRHSRPSNQCASSHLSPGHSFSPPSLLHSTLQRTFPYSHTHSLPLAKVTISRPATSPRRVSHSMKSQSHSLQAFSEDSGPWPCSVPWCLCIERETAIRTGAAFGFWSRVCRVIFNPVVVTQH